MLWTCAGPCRPLAAAATAQESVAATPTPIRSMAEFYSIAGALKSVPHPIDMEVQIACFDPAWGIAYFVSGDGPPEYAELGGATLKLQPRDMVRLTGTTLPGSPLNFGRLTVSRVGSNQPLKSIVVENSLPALLRLNIALVRLEAFVDGQHLYDPTHLNLHLIAEGQRILGVLRLEPEDPIPELEGHLVVAEGVLLPDRAIHPEHVARLEIGGLSMVDSHGPAAEDRRFSDLSITPIASLAQYAAQAEVGTSRRIPWVRVHGRIIGIDSGREITIADETGRVRVSTVQTRDIARQAAVEVCGIPTLTPRGWRLERPIIRASRTETPARPTTQTPGEPQAAQPTVESASQPQPVAPDELPLLSTMQDYWNVPPEKRNWRHRISLDLHIAYCDAGWDVLWAETAGQIHFFHVRRGDAEFSHGEVIRVSGLVRPASGALSIGPDFTVEQIEPYRPFETLAIDGDLTDPSLAQRMVRMTGLVESQDEAGPFHTALSMIVDGYRVTARYRTLETDRLASLVGRIVTLDGVLTPNSAARDGTFTAELWVGSLASIHPRTTLRRDPRFDLPPTFIEDLLRAPGDHPVRLVGTIREVIPGKSVTIEDSTDRITIRTAQQAPGAIHSRIEVWGYPEVSSAGVSLRRALMRELSDPGTIDESRPTHLQFTYRSTRDVFNLSPDTIAQGVPVKLAGIVTWSSDHSAYFFLRDSSAGIRVRRLRGPSGILQAPPAPGSVIVLTGRTAANGAPLIIDPTSIEYQTSTALEDPTLSSVEQAWSGTEDAQRIKLAGFVRSVSHETADGAPRWTHFDLVGAGGQSFRASMPHQSAADQFTGSVVTVTGVCEAVARGSAREIAGVTLWMNQLTDLAEVDKAHEDPFARDIQSIQSLRTFGGLRKGIGLARVAGTVLAHLPRQGLIVADQTDARQPGIHVHLAAAPAPQIGDLIDIVGLVGHDRERIALREARCRVIERGTTITPSVINSLQANPGLDCRLVQVRATLLDTIPDERRLVLRMNGSGVPFQATVDTASVPGSLRADLRPGSVLELTGVYRIGARDAEHTDPFNLLLRSAGDIRIIQRPSWFTAERARMLAIGLGAVLVLAFSWAYALRRRVRHQTGQIRKQLLKEARLEDRQRNIIEKASDFIFMLDLSGNFTLFNPAGEAMTGYSREDVPRLSIYDLIDENDRIGLRTALLKARPGNELQPFQSRFRRKDGTFIWVEVAIRFLVEEDHVSGALCVARDITERKRVEEELKRARDAAEANTRAKSAFLANMSHEIRTPMNGVIGMSNLLLDTPLSHDQRDFALTIRNSAEALLTVLNDILDFSKIEAGRLQFETLDFDLTETVDDTLDLLAARAASKRLELAALIPATLPRKLRGDPGRLRQVLLNLIGNAIKFTDHGEISVSVSLERDTPQGHLLRFEVHDTGIGISPEEQTRLFMPFSQADASTTRRFGGTGLGLAICRQIIEQMHGQIGVRSEPGKGSTFWFIVEFARGSEAPSDAAPDRLREVRVLGVDDNQVNRRVLQHYLETTGARLDLAAGAQEALGMLRAAATAGDPFELVLLDYHMPDMDGIALARAIQADSRLQAIPMALLTSVDRRFTAEELSAVGIGASLAKPIRQRELLQTIQRLLRTEHAPAPPPSAPLAPASPLPPMRILVAEDNPVNQRLTRIQLKKLGYEADLACNGLEVLEAFERVAYDVIFMDCQMPELDGYETARRLGQHPRRGDVRIVAMTANAMQGDRDKCLESGMDDYLSKPTRPDDLAAALRRAAEAITRTA